MDTHTVAPMCASDVARVYPDLLSVIQRTPETAIVYSLKARTDCFNHVCLQMALIIYAEKLSLYNISSKSFEPESLQVDTADKRWMCTPNGEALLSLSHIHPATDTHNGGQWVMDVFALEDCGEDQHLFQQLMQEHPVFNLPSQVCAAAAKSNM
jgi:hypothetical protein